MRTIETRKELTAEWKRVGVNEGIEYAILTDDISKAWSGMSTKEYKQYKGLKKEGLRDNMTNLKLILNMLAEASTTEISKVENPDGFEESRDVAKRGGNIKRILKILNYWMNNNSSTFLFFNKCKLYSYI